MHELSADSGCDLAAVLANRKVLRRSGGKNPQVMRLEDCTHPVLLNHHLPLQDVLEFRIRNGRLGKLVADGKNNRAMHEIRPQRKHVAAYVIPDRACHVETDSLARHFARIHLVKSRLGGFCHRHTVMRISPGVRPVACLMMRQK